MKTININTLPQLTGTEKQIKWANEIRESQVSHLNQLFELGLYQEGYEQERDEFNAKALEEIKSDPETYDEMYKYYEYHKKAQLRYEKWIRFLYERFQEETSAKWWIEADIILPDVAKRYNHESETYYYVMLPGWLSCEDNVDWWLDDQEEGTAVPASATYKEFLVWGEKASVTESDLIVPEETTTTAQALISVDENVVNVSSDKDDIVIKACKSLGYKWYAPNWSKSFFTSITDMSDAVAEVANRLLVAGVAVIVKDPEARRKAIDGTYTPTPTRVIRTRKDGMLYIEWDEYNNSIYSDARGIRGSKYDRPSVRVSPDQYLDIEGFAEKWGFVFTPNAQKLINEAKAKVVAATVKVTKGKEYVPNEFNGEAVLKTDVNTIVNKHTL